MHYTPGQLRETVGLSKETFRHWKRVVPAFSGRRGHAPVFSPGDLLASAILRQLTETCGVRIGHLGDLAASIFDICNHTSWESLSDRILFIDLEARECALVKRPADIPVKSTVMMCPLKPALATLQHDLLSSQRSARRHPPTEQGRLLRRGAK